MNDIVRAFSNGKAFIPFITVGDPDMETSIDIIKAMAEEGAGLIELGIPFSDPMAEGPVIQMANSRGLEAGVGADDVFDMAEKLRTEGVDVPLAIMTYANVVFSYGIDRFLCRMENAGFSALVLPDVPYEEREEFSLPSSLHGIALISLVAPTSEERIRKIVSDASGFIYCISSLGVTGMRSSFASNVAEMVDMVKKVRPDIPAAIGFGISDVESAEKMASISDGVIIGSAIVDLIAKYKRHAPEHVRMFVRSIVGAIRSV